MQYGQGGHLGHVNKLTCLKFFFPFSHKLPYEIWFQRTQHVFRNASFNFEIRVTSGQGQRMTLAFGTHLTLLTHLVECFSNFEIQGCSIFNKKPRNVPIQVRLWHKMDQWDANKIILRLSSESLSSYCKKAYLTLYLYCIYMYSNLNKKLFTLKLNV